VNRTLAGMVGIATEDMMGLPFATFFTPDRPGDGPIRLADAIARPDGMRWRLRATAGEMCFQIIAWISRDSDSGDAVYGLGREATEAAERAPELVCQPIDAAPVPAARPTTPFSVLQEPLRLIGDEEVHRLREEVSHLRREVLEQSGSAPGRPRRRPPRPMDAPAASGLETGETSTPSARRRKTVSRSLSGE
jgi:hypothetical protein